MKNLLLATALIATSTAALAAQQYQVFNQPNGQEIGIINQQNAHEIIPIFKKGYWVKVADKTTGDTGWIYDAPDHNDKARLHKRLHEVRQKQNYYNTLQQQMNHEFTALNQQFDQEAQQIQQQIRAENRLVQQDIKHPPKGMHENFDAISVKYNSDGKTATIIKKWLGKDGKMHVSKKIIPINQLNHPQIQQPRNQIHW